MIIYLNFNTLNMEIKEYVKWVNQCEDVMKLKNELCKLHWYMITWEYDEDIMDRIFVVRDRINELLNNNKNP